MKPPEPAPEPKPAEAPEKGTKGKAAKGKPAAKSAAKPEPAPEPSGEDLARLRAQAVLDYLLQAGAGADQVALGDGPAGERRSVALAPSP